MSANVRVGGRCVQKRDARKAARLPQAPQETLQPRKPGSRGAGKLRAVFTSRSSLFAWYRLIPVMLVFVLGVGASVVIKGPHGVQRSYYPVSYENEIQASCDRHVVSPYLVCAVIKAESDWNSSVVSHRGAEGLMQILPSTARYLAERGQVDPIRFPYSRLQDPDINIEYGTAYLRYLVNRYHEIEPVIAAYNAGPGNVDKWRKKGDPDIREVISFPETERYLLKVVRAKAAYEVLYPDTFRPPHKDRPLPGNKKPTQLIK